MADVRQIIHAASERLVFDPSDVVRQRAAKQLLVAVWDLLPASERALFLGKLDHVGGDYEFLRPETRWPDLNDPTLEAAARCWPYVTKLLAQDGAGQDYQFAKSIAKLLRMRRTPSEKQIKWMKELYADWRRWKEVDAEVVE